MLDDAPILGYWGQMRNSGYRISGWPCIDRKGTARALELTPARMLAERSLAYICGPGTPLARCRAGKRFFSAGVDV